MSEEQRWAVRGALDELREFADGFGCGCVDCEEGRSCNFGRESDEERLELLGIAARIAAALTTTEASVGDGEAMERFDDALDELVTCAGALESAVGDGEAEEFDAAVDRVRLMFAAALRVAARPAPDSTTDVSRG